ncbi:MAG TPA: LacI family DNA-binding transcriptional regulator [Galbitalea sp.]|jgi:LacI family transcriptional regulator
MATLSDVAARAGVSISAVSRVLSNAPSARVSVETRRRIQEAAAELGYRPNFAARALKFSRTNVVALVVPDLTNAIFTELMRGVETRAHELGYMVLLARAESIEPGSEAIARLIGEGRVDGVLAQVGDSMEEDDVRSLLDGGVPAVLVNSRRSSHLGSVILDDAAAARVAVEHLVRLGHTRIALVNGLVTTDSANRRGDGYRSAMDAAGLSVADDLVTNFGYEPRQGRDAMRTLAGLAEPPTAIVVANVNAAIGVLLEARILGLHVPEELSIVAVHDAWTAENTWPPLTTVRMPLFELGRQAMSAMVERITSGLVTDRVVNDPAPVLVVRESTAPPHPRPLGS